MNDEILTLYYYDELDGDERRRVEAALRADEALKARFDALSADLDALTPADYIGLAAELARRI